MARLLLLPLWCLLAGLAGACGQSASAPATPATMPSSHTERFELSASPGCADGYPATIDEARFSTPGGGSFPVPYGHFLDSGWGGSAIGWSVGDPMQPTPDSLEIRWFSYTEDKFYEGHFLLPQERIYQLLKQGLWQKESKEQVTYNDLSISVLPTGGVVVWLTRGRASSVLIGRYQAREVQYDYARHRPQVDRAADVAAVRAKLAPGVQQEIATHTISSKKWDDYLNTYPWRLQLSPPLTLTEASLSYVNAEATSAPASPDMAAYLNTWLAPGPKPVPRTAMLYVAGPYGRQKLLKVAPFDERETMAAFQLLAARHPGQALTLHVAVDERLTKASLSLRAGTQVLPLAHSTVQLFDLP